MSTLGIGLIGCGGMGRSETRQLRNIPEARLVAVADVAEPAAKEFGQEMGVPGYGDVRRVLDDQEIGAVIIATPNALHTRIVLDSLAGKHVFCEKPMAITTAECDQMIDLAEQKGLKLMVGQVLRLLPLFQRVIDIFDAGTLGKPVSAQITRLGWFGDPTARYRLRKATTGGLLYDIGVHQIDLLTRLFGPPESVYVVMGTYVLGGQIDYEDTAHLLLRYSGGRSAGLFESIAAPVGGFSGTILGEKGALRLTHGGTGTVTYRLGAEGSKAQESTVVAAEGENGYKRELESFTKWVLHDETPLLTWREGRSAIQITEAAYQSAATNQVVRIDAPRA